MIGANNPKINLRAQNFLLCFASIFLTLLLIEAVLGVVAGDSEDQEAFCKFDQILGWRHVAGKRWIFKTDEYAVEEDFNSKGIRGPEYSYEKRPEEFRILVLGDSFAEGYSVSF